MDRFREIPAGHVTRQRGFTTVLQSIERTGPQSESLEVSRALAASMATGRHELSARRLGHVYGDARLTPSARTRIASELDFCGLVILSEPWNEPLVVAKRPDVALRAGTT